MICVTFCSFLFLGSLCPRKPHWLVLGSLSRTAAHLGAVPKFGHIAQEEMNNLEKARQQTQTLQWLLMSQIPLLFVGKPQLPPSLLLPSLAPRVLGPADGSSAQKLEAGEGCWGAGCPAPGCSVDHISKQALSLEGLALAAALIPPCYASQQSLHTPQGGKSLPKSQSSLNMPVRDSLTPILLPHHLKKQGESGGWTVRAFPHTGFPAHKCIRESIKHREDFPLQDLPHILIFFLSQNKA